MPQMTDLPLKYVDHAVTMAEVPLEISLTISISNCAFRCSGCHSKYLWEDMGRPLLSDLETLLDKYNGLITCVCLLGEGQNPPE